MDDYEGMPPVMDDMEIAELCAELDEASKDVAGEIARNLEGFEADAMSYDIPL